MLTSFFKKSKPINFLLVAVFMSFFYIYVNFSGTVKNFSWSFGLQKIVVLLLFFMLMFLLNFIVKRNQVTQKNTFTIALFAVFTAMFTPLLENGKLLLSAFLVMLALRRIVSLRSGKAIKNKIFDAALWIALAAVITPPTFLFLGLVYFGIALFCPTNGRNWFLPLLSVITIFILKTCWNLFFVDQFYIPWQSFTLENIGFEVYNDLNILLPLSVFLAFTIWVIFHYFKKLQNLGRKQKPTYYLILASVLTGIFCILLTPEKNGAEILWLILPVSIIGANYFQKKSEKWFKESLLLSLTILCFIFLFINF